MKKITGMLIMLSLFTLNISAQYRAHEHGIAEMHMLLSENNLEIEINMPGADFIGYEYSNMSEEETAALAERSDSLEDQEGLVTLKMGWFKNAVLESVHVHFEEMHDHDADHDHDHDSEHSEYTIHILFSLDSQSSLKSADFSGLFKEFPTLEEVDWVLITGKGQDAGVVNASRSQIKF